MTLERDVPGAVVDSKGRRRGTGLRLGMSRDLWARNTLLDQRDPGDGRVMAVLVGWAREAPSGAVRDAGFRPVLLPAR